MNIVYTVSDSNYIGLTHGLLRSLSCDKAIERIVIGSLGLNENERSRMIELDARVEFMDLVEPEGSSELHDTGWTARICRKTEGLKALLDEGHRVVMLDSDCVVLRPFFTQLNHIQNIGVCRRFKPALRSDQRLDYIASVFVGEGDIASSFVSAWIEIQSKLINSGVPAPYETPALCATIRSWSPMQINDIDEQVFSNCTGICSSTLVAHLKSTTKGKSQNVVFDRLSGLSLKTAYMLDQSFPTVMFRMLRRGKEVFGDGWSPDLERPKTYNDKINWCKLYDQSPCQIDLVDKSKAFSRLEGMGLGMYNRQKLAEAPSFAEIPFHELSGNLVIKCNHDSGSSKFINAERLKNDLKVREKLDQFFQRQLSIDYGEKGGEWQYSQIKERVVFVEQCLTPVLEDLPADYKFHCSSGEVLWCQYIYDRGTEVKEVNVLPDGKPTDILFDEQFNLGSGFTLPRTWGEMLDLASFLSKPYKYVRIDLYSVSDRVFFGEVTFFPRGGYYPGAGQKILGELIEFDLEKRIIFS